MRISSPTLTLKELFLFLFGLWAFVFSSAGQVEYSYLDNISSRFIESSNMQADSSRHFGMRPWRLDKFSKEHDLDFIDSAKFYYKLGTKLLRNHLVKVEKDDFLLTLDPLLDFTYAYDFADTTAYADTVRMFRNTRGFVVQGKIGKTVSFRSSFMENQARFPSYIAGITNYLGVVPGQGRTKPYKVIGFDFAYSTGYVNWRPLSWLDLSVGNGKSFLGHGYRSVILSDGAFNRPYVKATGYFLDDKLQYTYTYAGLQSLERQPLGEVPESLFKRKAMSWQYLSYIPHPRVELGLFSAVVWERWDENSGTLPFNYLSLNPIPMVNAAILGWDDRENAVAGLNTRLKLNDKIHVYGQYFIDGTETEQNAYQVGLKYFDILPQLDFMAEYNSIAQNTYRSEYDLQSYVHFNQPLGHPGGSGLNEIMAELRYQYKRLIVQLRYNYLERDANTIPLFALPDGTDYFYPFGAFTNMLDARVMYYMNPKTNLRIELGYVDRFDKSFVFEQQSRILSLSLKTSIFNEYYDF